MYIISPLISQMCTASHKVTIKYVCPIIIRGLFEHKTLKPTNIRMSQGNVQNLAQLKQIMNAGLKFH